MYYSFQINGDENRMGGGESSINSVERREGEKGGRGRKREHWDQRKGDLPKGMQQVRGQARTKVLFPQNRMPPTSVHKRIIGAGVPTLLSQLLLRKLVERCMTGTL